MFVGESRIDCSAVSCADSAAEVDTCVELFHKAC
jgi:hypothetical protein